MFIKLVCMFIRNYICTIKLNRKQENDKEYGRSLSDRSKKPDHANTQKT